MYTGPRPHALLSSIVLHGAALGWMLAGPGGGRAPERPRTLYEQEIRPHQDKIVWYPVRGPLPEVSPLERRGVSQAPRAEIRNLDQTIVANPPGAARARQLIWQAAPRLQLQAELRSPNLLAFPAPPGPPAPPRPTPRLFAPPPETQAEAPPVDLPAAPGMQAAAALPRSPLPASPAAPPKPVPRAFVPPVEAAPSPAAPAPLPAAPAIQSAATLARSPLLPLPATPAKPAPRAFVAPRAAAPAAGAPAALPAAPLLGGAAQAHAVAGPPLAPQMAIPGRPAPRPFRPPAGSGSPGGTGGGGEAPALPAPASLASTPSNLSAAIVGLNPADRLEVPLPDGARQAAFSAAPEPRATGGAGEPVESARIFVPDLMVRGPRAQPAPVLVARSAPTSPANLLAAARAAPPAVAASAEQTAAVRVAAAPDPYLEGRAVYALSVQMPNVTSYSGSWILWFAERGRAGSPGAVLSPPVPLRKVDPKYIPSAAAERVEGRVRLAAVIRSDGRVDSVVLLRAVDERLDRSAEEALRKWLFEPAQRGGQPVDVDAVVEIPFRLAPLSSQP